MRVKRRNRSWRRDGTGMKERPILFTASNVRGILEDRKTQTRRVVKPPRWAFPSSMEVHDREVEFACINTGCLATVCCPYGQPGDRLWVRETFASWYGTEIFSGRPWPC